ncbi:hypothetical protein TUMEXPCC7403_24305 [Tumidithrix helvetica PCC 7403]|uniref:hypothetical protein n=1 Tax=Tumidithrix helvetica TaxID=3457545 RepID=UPI003C98AF8F
MPKTAGVIRQLSLIPFLALGMLLPQTAQAKSPPIIRSVRGITFTQLQFVASESKPIPALETAIRQASPSYVDAVRNKFTRPATYSYSLIDLNGDGKPEAIVYPQSSYFCGTGGCTLMIFQPDAQGYRLIGNIPVSRKPIIVTNQKTNGWKDLIRRTAGGGYPLSYSYLRYSQGEYTVTNEVPNNTAVRGKAVLTDDTDKGFELKAE